MTQKIVQIHAIFRVRIARNKNVGENKYLLANFDVVLYVRFIAS